MRVVSEQVDPAAVALLRSRLRTTRLPPPSGAGWEQGVPRDWLASLLEDWRAYSVEALQARLDGLTQLRCDVDGVSVHLVVAGSGPPLVMTHGWPGSFLEHLPVLPLLTPSFTVVLPSLPGSGWSGPAPAQGVSSRAVAAIWHRVMGALGHSSYAAHGSDLGAGVTLWLTRDHPSAVTAAHVATPGLAPAPAPRTAEEEAYAEASAVWAGEEGAYAHQHATRPATLAAGLLDSPAGLAAWVAEKVVAWSSTRPDGSPAYDRDLLLATLTLYWATGTIGTSLLPYWSSRHAPEPLPVDDPSPVPVAVSVFGGERVPFPKPPRALAERYATLSSYAEHPVGGHFPAVAEPELLASVLRETLLG